MLINILLIILGFILLVIGADLLIKGASNIAIKFHIPEILIGLTIVAIGTSAPELIITISSAINGNNNLIIGNAIGSNFCNLLLILGLMAIIRPVSIDKDTKSLHLPVAILAVLIIFFMCLGIFNQIPFVITRVEGIILFILFLIYLTYPIFLEIKDIIASYKENKGKNTNSKSVALSILYFIIGIVLLKYGSDFVVDYSVKIAELFNLSEGVIGSTIVAIGTASPELITSIVAMIKKDTDLAIGNLVGSCILNLFLILGIAAMISPLNFSMDFIMNLVLLIFSTFIVWLLNFVGRKSTITHSKGVFLLLIFGFYLYTLFV